MPRFVLFIARRWHFKQFDQIIYKDFQRKQLATAYFSLMRHKASKAVPMLSNVVVSTRAVSYASTFARADLQVIGVQGQTALVALMHNTYLPMATRVGCMANLTTQYNGGRLNGGDQELALARELQKCGADPDPAFRAEAKAVFQTSTEPVDQQHSNELDTIAPTVFILRTRASALLSLKFESPHVGCYANNDLGNTPCRCRFFSVVPAARERRGQG
jgi:hypothetical protein